MSRRAGAVLRLTAAAAAAWLAAGAAPGSAMAAASPQITLGTTTIAPGQKVAVNGTGWAPGTALNATICGADAVDGTADCANTSTVKFIASPTGVINGYLYGALPPQPCPCVVLVVGLNTETTETIPVTVVGATTAPVPPAPTTNEPELEIRHLRVTATPTVGSVMGAAAPRTLELRVHNAGPYQETPVLIGRWGQPTAVDHAITMPSVGSLAAGATKDVHVTFSLPAFSVGTYTVRVSAQVVGFTKKASATTSTTQWPFGLFALGALAVLVVVVLLVARPRRRRRRKVGTAPQAGVAAVSRNPEEWPPPPPPPEQWFQPPREPRRVASSAESDERSRSVSER